MASLYRRGNGYYYLSFSRTDRTPSRKQVATGTRNKREAERVRRRLEDGFRFGAFDPWRDDPRAFLRVDPCGGEPCGGETDGRGPRTLREAVAAFLSTRANLSPATREWYRSHLEALAAGVGEGVPLGAVTTGALQAYLDGRDVKPVTKHGCRRALRALFRWLASEGAVAADPVVGLRLARVPEKRPRALSPADVRALCDAVRAHERSPGVREGAGLWLLPIVQANVYLGLRAGEVVNLRWGDVDLGRAALAVRNTEAFTTKAGKERALPLCQPALDVLRGLERRPWPRGEFVFPNFGGAQLDRRQLSRRFKFYARKAGLPEHVNFHATRHTAASWLAQRGASVEAIRLYMGHSSITVTQRYMHLAPDAFAAQVVAAFARVGD